MQVGKYQLIHKLATGGMAEVFLAKAAGPKGFEKLLVLKRILPHLASEPSFVEMFLSEARLAAQLNHPNIVQIFDFGEADGTYFLAMEYIDGPNLREIIRRASGLGLAMPIALCARIIAAACEGLAFAHNFWDLTTGQELNIVHRDISPDNILLSRQGSVKVVDFGIAKAAGVSPHTQTGVLKGKLSYMPPEYLRNETLDGRVDVYSLGVVFYELLTGQRPFTAKSEAGMVQAILYEQPIPVLQWRPELPQAVQRILAKALSKERESRYLDCIALQEDLEEFIVSTGKPVGASQLAQLVAMMMAGVEVPGLVSQANGAPRISGRFSQLQSTLPPALAGGAPQAPSSLPAVEQGPPVPEVLPKDMMPTAIERPSRLTARFSEPSDPSPLPLLAPLPEPSPKPVTEASPRPLPESSPQPARPLPEPSPRPMSEPSPQPNPPARKAPLWVVVGGVTLFLAGGGYLLQSSRGGTGVHPPAPSSEPVEAVVPPPAITPKPPETPPSQTPVQPPVTEVMPQRPVDPPVRPPPPPPPARRRGKDPSEERVEETSDSEVENGTMVLQVEPTGTVLDVFMGPFKVGTTPMPPRPMPPGSYTLALKDDQKRVLATRKFVVTAGQVSLVKIDLEE
jgi:serine/threonine-protein kinase